MKKAGADWIRQWYSSAARVIDESSDDCDEQVAVVLLATNFSSEFNFNLTN